MCRFLLPLLIGRPSSSTMKSFSSTQHTHKISLIRSRYDIQCKWQTLIDWLSCGLASHSTRHSSFGRRSSQPISCLRTEKLKQTQLKQTCMWNKIYYNIKWTQQAKARFSRLLLHPAWKCRGPILATYHLLTAQGPTRDTGHGHYQNHVLWRLS